MVSAGFSDLAYYFETYGVMDFLLPFLLVFTIIYAVMQKTKILGDKKNFNVKIWGSKKPEELTLKDCMNLIKKKQEKSKYK